VFLSVYSIRKTAAKPASDVLDSSEKDAMPSELVVGKGRYLSSVPAREVKVSVPNRRSSPCVYQVRAFGSLSVPLLTSPSSTMYSPSLALSSW